MSSIDEIKIMAWSKARAIEGYDSDMFRKDACGAWIRRDMFGQTDNMFGWGIDLIFPKILGGTTIEINVRALNCRNLESKGNDYPSYKVVLIADGNKNVSTDKYLTINNKLRQILKTIYKNA